jgi:hypothetical protein
MPGDRNADNEGMDRGDAVDDTDEMSGEKGNARHRVRLPNFIVREPTGAGQVVSHITSAVGIDPCKSCRDRAARLDHWLRFEPRR